MPDIFISYARANEAEARLVTNALRALGHDVWRDDQLPVHRAYGQVIEERLNASRAVVVLWSAEAARSEWVRSEANRGREERKLVQLSLDGAPLPMPFDQFQCADMRGWAGNSSASGWQKVLESVAALLQSAPSPKPATDARIDLPSIDIPDQGRARVRTQPPMPPRLAMAPGQGFFGRTAERAILDEALASASAGQGRVVLLGGEPGIGKTRLATEVAHAAHATGATILFGFCDEDVALAYRPFADAIRHYLASAPDDFLDRHMRVHAAELTRLLPELRIRFADLSEPQRAEAETERFLLFEAVVSVLAEAAAETQIVLVIDDLQWASASDLLLLKHIVRAVATLPMLIIGTFRDSDLAAGHPLTPLLADLRRESSVTRIALTGVDEDAVLALVCDRAGHALQPDEAAVAKALYRDTAGNPFFLSEMLRNLDEAGVAHPGPEHWHYKGDGSDGMVPASVKEVIERRLARLLPATTKLLAAAAVIGRQFSLPLLERVVLDPADPTLTADGLLDHLDEAMAAGLLSESPAEADMFQFNHALVRNTLYESISNARRRRMHRRVGEALEAIPTDSATNVDALAFHWAIGADRADSAKAVGYARAAGDKAAASLAYEGAATHYQRALDVLPAGDAQRTGLLQALGHMQRSAGDRQFRTTMALVADAARQAGDGRLLAEAALGSGHPGGLQWGSSVDAQLVELYAEALAMLPAGEDRFRIKLMGQLATELRSGSERERRHQLTADALAMARNLGDQPTLARALMARIFAIEDPSMQAELIEITAELEALAESLGDAELGCLSANQRFAALLAAGDMAGADAALERCDQQASRLRVPFLALFPRMLRLVIALMRGDPHTESEVMAVFQAGLAIGLPHAANIFSAQMFELRSRQGRLDELLPMLKQSAASRPDLVAFDAGLILALCQTGDHVEAQQRLSALVTAGMVIPLGTIWASAIALLAEATGVLHDTAAAALLYPLVLPFTGQLGMAVGVRCYGSFSHPAGILAAVLGDWEAAENFFEAALSSHCAIDATVLCVSTRRAYATMLLDRDAPGDRDRAAAMIAEAQPDAMRCNMTAEAATLSQLQLHLADGGERSA